MEHVAARRAPAAAAATLSLGALALAFAAAVGGSGAALGGSLALLLAAPVALVRTVPWRFLLCAFVLVIAFIPIRRYTFPTGLPFELEPYRVLVAVLLAGWIGSLLVDRASRLRRVGFEGPIALVGVAALASVLLNTSRATPLQSEVVKSLSFLASFLLLFFLVAIVARTARDVDSVTKTLVISMGIVGVLAIMESRSGTSLFGRLDSVFPLLQQTGDTLVGRGTRAQGPAEHPIALGGVLVLAVPLAYYLATTSRVRRSWWWIAVGALVIGALATRSRTSVVMLVVVGLVYLWLRREQTVRMWPVLLPLLAAAHFAAPGTLGTVRATFFPEDGLITQQKEVTGDCDADGRIADLGPTLSEVATRPLLGFGYGTRIVTGEKKNACILDNQWLGMLVEVGIIGTLGFVWLFVQFIRRLGRAAAKAGRDGDLCVAFAASIAAYAISMFTYDAMSFIQVTIVLFLIIGLAAATLMRIERVANQLRPVG
jgi:polysaccharide biosynthesis protein PslJ